MISFAVVEKFFLNFEAKLKRGKMILFSIAFVFMTIILTGNTNKVEKQCSPETIKFPPHNVSDFGTLLLESDLFVDKSLLIKEFLSADENDTIVINRPIGWGKSLNLDMLRRFFEIEVDRQGFELPDDAKINKKLFLGGEVMIGDQKKVLKKLKIAAYPNIVAKYRGRFPVILFSLKNLFDVSYYRMRALVAKKLVNLYTEDFLYLKKFISEEEHIVSSVNKTELRCYYEGKISLESNFTNALYTLSYLLHEHFKKKVILLIDDYDEPLHHAKQKHCNETEQFDRYFNVIGKLLKAVLKDNPYLERACLTGVFPFREFGPRTGIDKLKHHKIPQEEFTEFYGFTEEEVKELMNTVPTKTKIEDMRSWYNGFYIGGRAIYTPISVLRCLKNGGKLQSYVAEDNRLDFMEGETISTEDFELGLQRFFGNNSRFFFYTIGPPEMDVKTREATKNVWFFLLFGGYLGVREYEDAIGYIYLYIPNYEAMRVYERIQLKWTTDHFEFPAGWQVGLGSLLGNYQIEEFQTELQKLLNTSDLLDKLDTRKNPDHKLCYNGLLLSIAYSMPPEFLLVGRTFTDLVTKVVTIFVPSVTSESKDGIIIEYNFISKKNASLAEVAGAAAKKMNVSDYEKSLKRFTYLENLHKLVIIFRKREIAIGRDKVPVLRGQESPVVAADVAT